MNTPPGSLDASGAAEVWTSGGATPRISVVVPVFNRASALNRLLEALGKQTYPRDRFEVLVCDDGSNEDLRPVVARASAEHGLRLAYLRQANAGPGAARNLGLARAGGAVVAFTDSDCVPAPGWLDAYARAMADPRTVLAGGFVAFRAATHLSGRCINFIATSTLGGAGAVDPRALVHMDYYPRTLNMAVDRDLARAAGGFTRHRHGEDLDFSHRAAALAGSPPRFVPEAVVLHDERRTAQQVFRENVRKGAARVRLYRDHGLHEPVHALPALLVLYALTLPLLIASRPGAAAMLGLPAAGYALALGVLGAQGAVRLGDPRATLAVPVYGALIHAGYGLGYLAAALRSVAERPARSPGAPAARREGPTGPDGGAQAAEDSRQPSPPCRHTGG